MHYQVNDLFYFKKTQIFLNFTTFLTLNTTLSAVCYYSQVNKTLYSHTYPILSLNYVLKIIIYLTCK